MAKAFHRLLHFLRRAQLLLLFLGVAYIMAGSVLMFQRFSFSSLQRETDSITIPSLPAPPGAQEDPAVRWVYRRNGARLMLDEENQPVDLSGSRSAQKHLRFHSLESRYPRRRWFHGNTDEPQRPPERNLLHKKNRHKGTYIGCFINNVTEHALGGIILYDFRKMTSALCHNTCSESGFRYAGLEYGAECHCGNRVYARRARGEECNLDCRGEKGSPCGGVGRLSVYRVEDRLPGQRKYAKCKERTFMPQRSSTLVALSSFPGAGNTWLRHLIESATGFYTGSYYFDGSLYNKGFKGEKDHWQSGRVLCVKTHESGQREIEMFDSAILLMRNPYRSLMAEFNRKCAGHLGYASDARWRSKEWLEFVDSYSSWWVSHALAWLKFARRLLVVHFENLQKDLVPQFRTITVFLNISIPEERLLCTESNRDGHFKRSGSRILTFEPFTSEMRERIDKYIQTVDRALRDRNLNGLPKEYLHR
ncbi:WSC domain-containing protein 1 [Triplophysa tibetana]|uniref:WSC domain-containing protein 1 n=1 Tax=Triplophysa tibetana TaxID=1572043 RepID=A0A5A9N5D7_9TELE|nr:WSC domain-containing protein 1 [Triplophysa tibetana]